MKDGFNALFEENINQLATSLYNVMQKALREYKRMQSAGIKGELSHIHISLLLSSVLCKLPWLRIDLYDESELDDIVECSVEWDVLEISSRLYLDADIIAKQGGKIKDYELEQFWLDHSVEYYKAFEYFLPEIISYYLAKQFLACRWHFGSFLGNTSAIWEYDKR